MNYLEAVNYIHSLLKFGIRPGLSGMNALLHLLDNPEKGLKYVHVAGTNGKGSTSTAISNVLVEAGYNVGLYTSPYVSHFLERVQFNGKPVDEDVFARSVEKVESAVEELHKQGIDITEFEALTASAFICFEKLRCDVVVLEVGLGGRLDATNVIARPLVNIITSLSLDHTAILGDTVEQIAFEKCGTLKSSCRAVVSYGQPLSAQKVINSKVSSLDGTLVVPDESKLTVLQSDLFGTRFSYCGTEYFTVMAGAHQLKNMTCVIEACKLLQDNFNITDEHIQKGISKTVLPARVEVISRKPLVVLDGGHNADGAKAFFDAVKPELNKKRKVIVIGGMMADKAVEASLKPLMLKTDVFLAVTPENSRAMKAEKLAEIATKYSKKAFSVENVKKAVDIAFSEATESTAILVVGSLYLAGEIRAYLTECSKNFN